MSVLKDSEGFFWSSLLDSYGVMSRVLSARRRPSLGRGRFRPGGDFSLEMDFFFFLMPLAGRFKWWTDQVGSAAPGFRLPWPPASTSAARAIVRRGRACQ